LVGDSSKRFSIIFNCAESKDVLDKSDLFLSKVCEERFSVLFLGNLNLEKGADRLLAIAKELESRGEHRIIFLICGEDRQNKGKKGIVTMEAKAESEGISGYFYFAGHQPRPEPFLRCADLLIRLSRNNDPWGRDIIEAMIHGKPIMATGKYDRFVQPGINGFLLSPFSASEAAERILDLMYDSNLRKKMGDASLSRGKEIFDANRHALLMEKIYDYLCNK
jgi:glycosyltransferase involved in cell wall biosynthesis